MLINSYHDMIKEKESLLYALSNYEIKRTSSFSKIHNLEETLRNAKCENDKLIAKLSIFSKDCLQGKRKTISFSLILRLCFVKSVFILTLLDHNKHLKNELIEIKKEIKSSL